EDVDGVFHLAAMYEVGIARERRSEMYEANVHGTENVLDAAVDARVPRTVYAFGNTRGAVVDETYVRPVDAGYVSAYDWTKHVAHEVARERIERGGPVVVVQPGAIYGPGDHSELGSQLEQARNGTLLFRALS